MMPSMDDNITDMAGCSTAAVWYGPCDDPEQKEAEIPENEMYFPDSFDPRADWPDECKSPMYTKTYCITGVIEHEPPEFTPPADWPDECKSPMYTKTYCITEGIVTAPNSLPPGTIQPSLLKATNSTPEPSMPILPNKGIINVAKEDFDKVDWDSLSKRRNYSAKQSDQSAEKVEQSIETPLLSSTGNPPPVTPNKGIVNIPKEDFDKVDWTSISKRRGYSLKQKS